MFRRLFKRPAAIAAVVMVMALALFVSAVIGSDASRPAGATTPDRAAVLATADVGDYTLLLTAGVDAPEARCFVIDGFDGGSTVQCEDEPDERRPLGVVLNDRGSGLSVAAGYAPTATAIALGGDAGRITPEGFFFAEGDVKDVLVLRSGDTVLWERDPATRPAVPAPDGGGPVR